MKCDELKKQKYCQKLAFGDEVYLAKQVDAAIAELKQKLENVQASMYADVVDANMDNRRLKEKYKELAKLYDKAIQACCDADKVIAHHKYKRCLAVARRCHNESLWWYSNGYGFEKYDKFWEKWEKRWLELAEKFKDKEAK